MAITKIKAIKKRLDHVINYIINPAKTSKVSYKELHNLEEYSNLSYETEEQLYVTAINCDKESAYNDMMSVKKRYSKLGGNLGFHIIQSFKEGEVTPNIAHEIGIKFAQEIWGERFQIVVATHLNTKKIHNHITINSVSFRDGKKYYDNHKNYALMRAISDSLCKEYKLSVIEEKPCPKSSINYGNFLKSEIQKSNYYNEVKDDIDYAIEQAYSFDDFIGIMKKMNYDVINRYGKLSVKKTNRKRNIRIERFFGEEYTIANIRKRIFETESVRIPFHEVRTLSKKYRYSWKNKSRLKDKRKVTGIRALYFHYCYLLKVYPSKKKRISKELREDIKKMDKLSDEARFLCNNNIQTQAELLSYKSSSTIKKSELKSKREYLWRKFKNVKTEDEKENIKNQINEISAQIKSLKYEIELIEDIETRIPEISQKIRNEKSKAKNKEFERKEFYK